MPPEIDQRATPWMNLKASGAYAHRHPRTLAREIKAGRLRAARIGGRGEFFCRAEWIDEWMEAQAMPIPVPLRRRG